MYNIKEVNISFHSEEFQFKKIEVSYDFTPQVDYGPNEPKTPYSLKITSIISWSDEKNNRYVDIIDCLTKSAIEKIEKDILEDELGVKI